MRSFMKLAAVGSLLVSLIGVAQEKRTPTEDGVVYGVADGQSLTMDYYAPKGSGLGPGPGQGQGRGPHPIAIVIHGGGYHGGTSKNGSEAYVADFLAPAGYAVFSVNYRLAPQYPYPYMVYDVQRAVRFIRHNAKRWDADPNKIALVGGSAGGFLSNMVGLLNAPGDPNAADPVDRESAQAQAVVSLYAQSSFEFVPLNEDVHRFLDPWIAKEGIAKKSEKEAIREASPITYVNKDDPPFLEILGDQDEYIPMSEATNLQDALHKVGVQCDIIRIPGGKHGTGGWNKLPGAPDWEREMTDWLNARLHHVGPIGEGIRARVAEAPNGN
jgi:acetyl esterase/lipase